MGVMQGYSAVAGEQESTAQVMQQASLLGQTLDNVFDKRQNDSLYAGTPRDPARNLLEINLRRRRENNLYSFY
jgi:hypothetical protein